MCGITGYVGSRVAIPILMDGLRRLEYRGYDSAGVAVVDSHSLAVCRSVGRLSNLDETLRETDAEGSLGIGHTRWATHGEPSQANSHPHTDEQGEIAVVHNGIIENYQELKEELAANGCRFRSETDSEVIPHLIAAERRPDASNIQEAIRRALTKAHGAYALAIVCQDEPKTLYAARNGSPLIIGVGDGEFFIASDVPAIVNYTNRIIYLDDGQIAALGPDGVTITRIDGSEVQVQIQEVRLKEEATTRAGFETYMLKEIHEQPRVLRHLLRKYVAEDDRVRLHDLDITHEDLVELKQVMTISCGTAFHAALYGKQFLESISEIAVTPDVASEFRYSHAKLSPHTMILAVSQSGETADTLASVQLAREHGCRVISVCNVPGSSLVRNSDAVIYTDAGLEIGVASTKAYTTQLMALALLSIYIARERGELDAAQEHEFITELRTIPDAIHYVIERKDGIRAIADKHHDGPSSLYLGRRFNYPTALEGALKNKEISYQHAEAYAAGEMKHGPIALINEYLPVICICTQTRDAVYEKMLSNVQEVRARHGRIIAIASDGDTRIADLAEDVIYVPFTREEFSPMVNVVALQLLAYYAAQARGTDIDKPRNLAKSVTVE